MKQKIDIYILIRRMTILSGISLLSLIFFLSGFPQQTNTFRICTFNIQNFGKTKLSDSLRVNKLAGIIRKYEIVAVQEVSDVSGIVPVAFRDIINKKGDKVYAVACSERTGKQADDRTSQEQYAFFYDTTMFALMSAPLLYNDSAHDFFAREPYIARFKTKSGTFSFVLITIHTAPDTAVEEIGSLDEVVKWAKKRFSGETEFIILGDFNASCTYAKPDELDRLTIRGPNYYWIVPDDAKTNLSAKSDCAYDRFVITLPTKSYYTGNWGVDGCFTSKTISDHWPVWAEFTMSKQ